MTDFLEPDNVRFLVDKKSSQLEWIGTAVSDIVGEDEELKIIWNQFFESFIIREGDVNL